MEQHRLRVCRGIDYINKEESEANYFARVLLIPSHRLKEIVYKLRYCPSWDLIPFCSDYFQVPELVIRARLKELGFTI